jgi:hypothetical protein
MPPTTIRLTRITPKAPLRRALLRLHTIHPPNSTILILLRHPILQMPIQLTPMHATMPAFLPRNAFPGALEPVGAAASGLQGDGDGFLEGGVDAVEVMGG